MYMGRTLTVHLVDRSSTSFTVTLYQGMFQKSLVQSISLN